MNTQAKLSIWETFWYYLTVILTLGGAFTLKVIIKKAIIEGNK